ncbi:aromatic ring-hydroxylating oxygenase subunit alpha [Coralliovum pocilloporae]|uniref:aromatic ring-hydroxylating oxygenase subunit alpha n=1 Tax=Coralliovum pocilloporae TaxID=3066369 RepID=UPI0033071C37
MSADHAMLHEIAHDPDGRKDTLAAYYYTDQKVMEAEVNDLLYNSWQFVCHVSDIAEPKDFYAFSLQGQEYFLTRTTDGDLKGYHNVCPHRGHRLVNGSGRKSVITCPYHAWTFGLDGNLRGARGVDRKASPERHQLIPIRVDVLLGLVFVSANPDIQPLADYAPGMAAQMLRACPDLADYVVNRDGAEFGHTYLCDANWKIMLDNYLECYHCQMAHPEFNEMMDIGSSTFSMFPNYTYQNAPTRMKADNAAFPLDLDHDVLVGEFWWMFPNIVFGQFPGTRNFYVSRFDPLEPGRTSRYTLSLKPKEPTDPGAAERERLRSIWTTTVVSVEDKELCENVQRGMNQRGFKNGWYVNDPGDHGISEHAMRHFHDLYRAWADKAGNRRQGETL